MKKKTEGSTTTKMLLPSDQIIPSKRTLQKDPDALLRNSTMTRLILYNWKTDVPESSSRENKIARAATGGKMKGKSSRKTHLLRVFRPHLFSTGSCSCGWRNWIHSKKVSGAENYGP